MNALIIGGTSGLGFCVAQLLIGSYTVHITGRADPHAEGLVYHEFDIEPSGNHFANIEKLLDAVGQVDLLVYAAGYFQDGTITDITEFEIATMEAVGLTVPMLVVRSILMRQGALAGFIAITSTSEWTPRLREPVYTAVKAGLGMFARSISLDDRLKKGPSCRTCRYEDLFLAGHLKGCGYYARTWLGCRTDFAPF
jgi:NAD(P)-dependent dehydrogenase (short-subunit alcohol dehydrogenase family)